MLFSSLPGFWEVRGPTHPDCPPFSEAVKARAALQAGLRVELNAVLRAWCRCGLSPHPKSLRAASKLSSFCTAPFTKQDYFFFF